MFRPLKPEEVNEKLEEIKVNSIKTFKPYIDAYKKTYGRLPQGGIPRSIFRDPNYMQNLEAFKKIEQLPKIFDPIGTQDCTNDPTGTQGPTGAHNSYRK